MGIDLSKHDVRFVEDNWESQTLGAACVGYEYVDEAKYIFVPNTTNDSSLNPDEVLTILY